MIEKVLERKNLMIAYKSVVGNKGSSGVDGIETKDLRVYLLENWPRLKDQLETNGYYPNAILGIEILKESGGKRLLGIPTVFDRLIQQAIHQVLSPIWETDFSDSSFGFRPKRNAGQAIKQAQAYINYGYQELERRGLRFVRYCDDFSIFLGSKRAARRVMREISRFVRGKLHLEINHAKSAVRRPVNYEYLGFGFVPTYKKGETGKYQLIVSSKSLKRLRAKIKLITRKTIPCSFDERIQRLNRLLYGWLNYFKYASIFNKLKYLDAWVRDRLRYCIWHHWKKPNKKMRSLIRLGIDSGQAYSWSRTRMGGWRVACSPILGTTITIDRLKLRGYIPFLEYYLNVRS